MSSLKPAIWYFNTDKVKKIFKKNGRTPEMALKDLKFALADKRVGQSSWFVGLLMIILPLILLFVIHNSYFFIFNDRRMPSLEIYIYPFILYVLISYLFSYFLLFRHDKYIKYFKKFEKQPREWKVKWAWISAGVILFPFLVLASSFIAMLPK